MSIARDVDIQLAIKHVRYFAGWANKLPAGKVIQAENMSTVAMTLHEPIGAADAAHIGLFLNHGQCCCASSRIFVDTKIYDQFSALCIERAKTIQNWYRRRKIPGSTSRFNPISQGDGIHFFRQRRRSEYALENYMEVKSKNGAVPNSEISLEL